LGLFLGLDLVLFAVGEALEVGEQRVGEAVLLRLGLRRGCRLLWRSSRHRGLRRLFLLTQLLLGGTRGFALRLFLLLARRMLFLALLLLGRALFFFFALARRFLLGFLARALAFFLRLALHLEPPLGILARLALGLELGLGLLLQLDLGFRGLERRLARGLDLCFGVRLDLGGRRLRLGLGFFLDVLLGFGAQLRFHFGAGLGLGLLLQPIALRLRFRFRLLARFVQRGLLLCRWRRRLGRRTERAEVKRFARRRAGLGWRARRLRWCSERTEIEIGAAVLLRRGLRGRLRYRGRGLRRRAERFCRRRGGRRARR